MDLKQEIIDMVNSIDNDNALNYIRIVVSDVKEDVELIKLVRKEKK